MMTDKKRKLLWVGDAGCQSGFARATHEILTRVSREYDVNVLGINYRGDPFGYPSCLRDRIYAAAPGGDAIGFGRLLWMCDRVRPDIIVIQNDGWFIPLYFQELRKRKPDTGEYEYPEYAAIPVVASLAVDGCNFRGGWIKDVHTAVFWTEFALNEARIGGYAGKSAIIPLGVDLDTFYPVERAGALERQKIPMLADRFIIGNVNRNQSRKRLDLTLRYFSEWIRTRKVPEAQLFIHTAPTGDENMQLLQLAQYYGILNQLALRVPETFYGNPDDDMRDTYNCFSVQVSTTQGEGFGLTTFEGMACGVAQAVPDWAALGELVRGAASLVKCTATAMQSPNLSVIGGVADERMFLQALDTLYDESNRRVMAQAGLKLVQQARFRWENIGQAWLKLLDDVMADYTRVREPDEIGESEIWQEIKTQEVAR